MKKIFFTGLMTLLIILTYAQEQVNTISLGQYGKCEMEIGFFTNSIQNLNEVGGKTDYEDFEFLGLGKENFVPEITLGIKDEIFIPTKIEGINIMVGGLFESSGDVEQILGNEILAHSRFQGGGVYGGVRIQKGSKHFGVYSSVGLGYFSYKYLILVREDPIHDVNALRTSNIGGIINLGMYLQFEGIGFTPYVHGILTGNEGFSVNNLGGGLNLIFAF